MADLAVQTEAQRRLRKFLIFRLVITVLGSLLVTFYLAQLPAPVREATCIYLYSLLSLYLVVGIASLLTLSSWRHMWVVRRLQIITDFAIQGALIWSTGGVVSIFAPILFVTLAATTGLVSSRGALVLATLSAAFLAATTVAYMLGFCPATAEWSRWLFTGDDSSFILAFLIASMAALFAISILGSKLSSGLERFAYLRQEILENLGEGIVVTDRDGRLLFINGEARSLLGLPGLEADYLGLPLRAAVAGPARPDGDARDDVDEVVSTLLTTPRRRLEGHVLDASGRLRPVEVKASSILDDKSRIRCRVGLLSDLTLKREVEAAERRIQKLEELQIMAMGIAHEIRNPLASVRGCVQELGRGGGSGTSSARLAEIVMRESDRLDRIIEDFLHYARSGPSDMVPLDVSDLVGEAVDVLEQRADIASRTIEWHRPPAAARVFGDRDQLLQVLLNLGINAIQATDPATGRITVEVRGAELPRLASGRPRLADDVTSGVSIELRDNGCGVDPDDETRVFTPFYTTKSDGSGLGLSIVERIVREHMGYVGLSREPSGGCCARIVLPGKLESRENPEEVRPREPNTVSG